MTLSLVCKKGVPEQKAFGWERCKDGWWRGAPAEVMGQLAGTRWYLKLMNNNRNNIAL